VDAKFDSLWDGWCSREPVGAHGVGLWKNIRKRWGIFFGLSRLEVGDGLGQNFGMICGAGIGCSRNHFLFFLV
jgi:hypothetical protein